MHKQIAVDLAKSVYQVAESVRAGQVSQRKRLNREAFRRYIQEQAEPVEWLMEACSTAHYWGRLAQLLGHRVTLLHPRYVRPYRRWRKIKYEWLPMTAYQSFQSLTEHVLQVLSEYGKKYSITFA